MIKETGGPAFPNASIKTKDGIDVWGDGGMTLRDYFAAKVMQGILASGNTPKSATNEEIAKESYHLADVMLKAREQ